VAVDVPDNALPAGFKNGPGGVHDSRTMMLGEIRALLEACPEASTLEQYRQAVIDENTLRKDSHTARTGAFRRLRELYALDDDVLLFRALRVIWADDPDAQPLLALLCTVARDPTFRGSVDLILATPHGGHVSSEMIARAIEASVPGRYAEKTLGTLGRNMGSTWTQSGHLEGRAKKIRVQPRARPASIAYALLLAHLCGARGDGLFDTIWARLLDTSPGTLRDLAQAASGAGWIEYRHMGSVTDVGFSYLLGN
jgi:hypothetical protein